jgi:hypothetical protein
VQTDQFASAASEISIFGILGSFRDKAKNGLFRPERKNIFMSRYLKCFNVLSSRKLKDAFEVGVVNPTLEDYWPDVWPSM